MNDATVTGIWRRIVKFTAVSLFSITAILWLAALPVIADFLMGKLVSPFPPLELDDVPPADCIVLLGGGIVQPPRKPGLNARPGRSIGRLYKANELYFAGKANWVIVSAGGASQKPGLGPEAEHIQALMIDAGVPIANIQLESTSTTTWENALYSKKVIDSKRCELSLLVTSSSHMPRSLAAFRRVGINVFPVSSDLVPFASKSSGVARFLPSMSALLMTQEATREWLARLIYKSRGWN